MAPIFLGRRRGGYSGGGGGSKARLIMGLVVAGIAVVSYFSSRQVNPVTHEVQHISISPQQEIALGLQAAPEMEAQYGGEDPDPAARARVDAVGQRLLEHTVAKETPYRFDFHLLGDRNTINAFALPGGQVFITRALYDRLQTEGQLAGVLGHEMGHVISRHGAEQLAKQQLTQGLTGAAVLATYDPNDPRSRQTAAVAAAVGALVNMKFGREDELEADRWGVRLSEKSGYDPHAMIQVMKILEQATQGRGQPPEFFSTHPNPGHRIQEIEAAIAKEYPNGLPPNLKP